MIKSNSAWYSGPGLMLAGWLLAGLLLQVAAASDAGTISAPPQADDEQRVSSEVLQGSGDAAIRCDVLRKLRRDPHVKIADLEVVVQDGVITLYGRTANSADKHIASRYADDVRGARGVMNAINVVPGLGQMAPQGQSPEVVAPGREDDPYAAEGQREAPKSDEDCARVD